MRLVAACRNDAAALAAFSAEFGCKGYRDYRELLADPAIGAVAIALPHHLHAEVAVAAARAGKAIMVEKPLAPTVGECRRILAAARDAGVTLMPGHTMRFTLPFLAARRLIESGEVGRMRFGSSRMIKLWMEANRRDWHLDPERGGGMLFTAGIHALDRLIALAGRRATHVSAVTAAAFHDQAVDDSALILVRFGEDAAGLVASIGYRTGAFISGDEIVCENGVLRVDFLGGVELGRGQRWEAVAGSFEDDIAGRALVRQWRAFAGAVRTGAPPPVTGEDGLHVAACIEAAFRAARERREVAVEEAHPAGSETS